MVVTEEEASTKWCCAAMNHPTVDMRCVASKCMAWIENHTQYKMPDGDIYYHYKEGATKIVFGYCGLTRRYEP